MHFKTDKNKTFLLIEWVSEIAMKLLMANLILNESKVLKGLQ